MIGVLNSLFFKVESILERSSYYLWFVLRKIRERQRINTLSPFYDFSESNNKRKIVVCPYEGKAVSGGLADRFRGILSTYYITKELGIEFKLYYKHPFDLECYLEPNKYDWRLDADDLTYQISKDSLLVLDTTEDSCYQKSQQKKWLEKRCKKAKGQVHVYTNASFSYDLNYGQLFAELFKPTPRLQESIDNQLSSIGGRYISVSCRFLDLLGDFNETYGHNMQLTDDEKEQLILSVINQVEILHQEHSDYRILCNSDSVTFLQRAQELDYAYVIPGEVTHIDARDLRGDYQKYEKTFLDFYMIANAEHIYMLKTGLMHNSGFPFAASKLYNKPFDPIVF